MCSIAGVYWLNKKNKSDVKVLRQMVEKALVILKNRGPDESAITEINENCVMGGNRLIIRGDIGKGSMPFIYGKNVSYYNGEIYNYKNWNKSAVSDGEIILPLYNELKERAFKKFDGEFAISLWDNNKESVYLIRDQFGTKPIYFSLNKDRLIWASSASAINEMEPHTFCRCVKSSTYKHAFAIQEPYTSFKGIWLVPPGHFLVVNYKRIDLFCYNFWPEYSGNSLNTNECFDALTESLKTRLNAQVKIGIPMSAGIDSGIIAFMADKLKINYHIFSLVEIFGKKTEETDVILERISRLKNCGGVTLIKFEDKNYLKALNEIYSKDYYDSMKFDGSNLLMHAIFNAMNKEKIRVAIDGSGGDELFYGYKFRDDYKPVRGWPRTWKRNNYCYSLYTTLLDYTSKSDRAGSHFSIEARYPFQTVRLMKSSLKLKYNQILKWPLRQFLIKKTNYGKPTNIDLYEKYGFSVKNNYKYKIISDMKKSWCLANGLISLPNDKPLKFPFKIGIKNYD